MNIAFNYPFSGAAFPLETDSAKAFLSWVQKTQKIWQLRQLDSLAGERKPASVLNEGPIPNDVQVHRASAEEMRSWLESTASFLDHQ